MAEHRKRILHNFISLSLVQGLSIIFPLVTFPYLLRVLGVEQFGVFTMIQTLIMYFDLLVSFGFGLTATQHIARSLNDSEKTSRIINAVYVIKISLFIVSILLLLISCLFIPYMRENFHLVLIASMYLVGNILFPDWYFQGIQKMRNITVVAFVSKFIGLLLIVLLVKEEGDIAFAVLALSAGNFIAGMLGFFILVRTITLRFEMPARRFILSVFRESAYVFTSIILAPLYSSVNLFILRAFTNPLMVGYYAIAEKIYSAVVMLTNIANRTFYPHLSQLYASSAAAYRKNVRIIVLLFLAAFSVLSIALFFSAEYIVQLVSGKHAPEDIGYAVEILKIMSIGLLMSPFVSFFFQLLIIQGQKKAAITNIFSAVIINLVSGCIFTYFYSGKGMAINLCLIVFIIALLNFVSFRKKHSLATN
jgi:PST family polysaccharide transporter